MDDIASQDLELLIRNNEKKPIGGEYFELNDQGGSTITEKQKPDLKIFFEHQKEQSGTINSKN